MANINSFNKTIGELEEKIARLNSFYEEQARILEANRDSANYSSIQSQSYREEEQLTKELGGSLEVFMKKISDITNRGLEEIEDRLEKHNLEKEELLKKDYEAEKKFIEDRAKDEDQKRKLLLALDEEYNKKVFELEKSEYEKRKNLVKSSLVGENQTVFEQLNERFEKEKEEYKKNGLDTLELEKAYNKKRKELAVKQVGQIYSAIKNLVRAGEEQINDIAETWGVTNQAAHDYGKTVGLTANKIEKLHAATIGWMSSNNISKQFNIGADEMFKIMGSYNKELNRAVALTNETKLNLVSMRNVMGDEQAIKFTANLDKFGLDVDASKELVQSIVGDARRSGIVLSNLTQSVADNLHLAQQYTFEDGIEGLVRMAEKAAAVKWNMQQTAAFAEKVNNVEGAIKTGAQLSVLGGPFAQFSNPMGMLYESLNDMEGLQDRLFAMFGNLGEWNQEKGMLDISVFDKQRIKAAASAMGLNYGDVINTVQSQARRNVVMDQVKGLGLDDNATELIANTAQIDRDTGKAYVMYNDEKVFADQIGSRKDRIDILRELGIQANSKDEDLKDIARNTLGAKDRLDAIKKEMVTDKADMYQMMSVTKDKLADTYEAVLMANEIFKGIDRVLGVISSTVMMIASVSAFRGYMNGSTGPAGQMAGGSRNATSANGYVGARGGYVQTTRANGGITRSFANGTTRNYSASTVARYNRMYGNRTGGMSLKGGWGTNLGVGAGMALGIGGTYASSLMDGQSQKLREKGLHDDADAVNMGGGILGGIAQGAAMGMMFGPWGALIGAGIGGVIGGFSAGSENQRIKNERERNEWAKAQYDYIYDKTGIVLYGDYNEQELISIRGGRSTIGGDLIRKMESQGDGEAYSRLPVDSFGSGGLIRGRSHANGGTIIEAENNEFVVNARSTQNNLPLLNAINDNTIRPTQVLSDKVEVGGLGNTNHHMGFDNLNVNMNGGLQLSLAGGNTQTINSSELLSNPSFINGIRDEIIKQINYTTDKSFRKDNYYKKF